MRLKSFVVVVGGAIALWGALSASADATPVFVGSWEVNQGPYWGTDPIAYTGQEAAALLFGGSPSDYSISTVDSNPADINNMAWYSVIGYYGPNNGGIAFAQDYVASGSDQCCGLYYSGGGYNFNDVNEAASAYVADNAGPGNVNFAFENVPEPLTISLLGTGLAATAAMRRRRKAAKQNR